MNTMPITVGVASRPIPKRRATSPSHATATTYRQYPLAEIVRDLAGWTLPTYRPEAGRQPEGWQLA